VVKVLLDQTKPNPVVTDDGQLDNELSQWPNCVTQLLTKDPVMTKLLLTMWRTLLVLLTSQWLTQWAQLTQQKSPMTLNDPRQTQPNGQWRRWQASYWTDSIGQGRTKTVVAKGPRQWRTRTDWQRADDRPRPRMTQWRTAQKAQASEPSDPDGNPIIEPDSPMKAQWPSCNY